MDQPNLRSSHTHPTPRGGGFAFVVVAVAFSILALLPISWSFRAVHPETALPLIVLPIAFVGFLDDLYTLPASFRYCVQLGTAQLVILVSPLPIPSLALLLLPIAVTAIINFTNFMDGVDGLVAGCMAIVFVTAYIRLSAPWPLWSLVGALLGFLLWNWSPAQVFMGDVGSTFLGALFAGLVLQAPSWFEALGLLAVCAPLLADAGFCVLRRLLAGQSVFQAHSLHLFQRLYQAGWSHARVATLFIGATVASCLALLFLGLRECIVLVGVQLLVGFWLDQRVAVPFQLAIARAKSSQPLVPD
jgi:Fuc2NAc and GlcNAc transferase